MKRFKSVVVGLLVAVVVFGGTQVASAKSGPCKRVGATKVRVASGKTVTCVKIGGKLVWQVLPTVAPPTTVAPTVVVVPAVSIPETWLQDGTLPKAVSVTSNVVGTVYLVDATSSVGVVGAITGLPSKTWMSAPITQTDTPTVVAIGVTALFNSNYKVYVANTAGVLSAPAINMVTISVTLVGPVTLTCATGGSCEVGDTGPGGGIVFYDAGEILPWGRYLEVAPNNWNGEDDPTEQWVTDYEGCYGGEFNANDDCQWNSIYPYIPRNTMQDFAVEIGMGMTNTLDIVARQTHSHSFVDRSTYAAGIAYMYASPTKSDWFLPSFLELNELCKYARTLPTGEDDPCFDGEGVLRDGFTDGWYWSSTEEDWDGEHAYTWDFGDGDYTELYKYHDGFIHIRPIRAF